MACIFCGSTQNLNTIEHIVNESLVNYHYTLPKGSICDSHNNLFSKFERDVLTKSIFGMERTRFGIITKKGKPAKAKTGAIEFQGDREFRKSYLTAYGLKPEHIKDFDPVNKTFKLTVPSFDKSEAATAKFLLKVGFECLYRSKPNIFSKHALAKLIEHLSNIKNYNWPFIITKKSPVKFISIPRYEDKYRLSINKCHLEYYELVNNEILFRFSYGGITAIINLTTNENSWISTFMNHDPLMGIYPASISKKFKD
jgi:hypothetical protein